MLLKWRRWDFRRPRGTFYTHNPRPANSLLLPTLITMTSAVNVGFDGDGSYLVLHGFYRVKATTSTSILAVDLNPENAYAKFLRQSNVRRSRWFRSGRTFDFDFDGHYDLIVGYHHQNYNLPGQTRLYFGNGDGTFDPDFIVIGQETDYQHRFSATEDLSHF